MQVDQEGADRVAEPGQPSRRGAKRALVGPPGERAARAFSVSLQAPSGRRAACRRCGEFFKDGQPRINLLSDATCGRYQHLHCLGALRNDDTLQGLEEMPQDVRREVASLRAAGEEPEEGEVQLPLAQIPRTMQAEAERRGMDWWDDLTWGDAKRLHGQTLIDVPKTLVALYAELKMDIIADIEAAEEAMEAGDSGPRELAWMRLSFVDAMVLNSSRAAGESQTQSVARRIRQARDDQWEALWQDATARHERGVPERASKEEREKKAAARLRTLPTPGRPAGRPGPSTRRPPRSLTPGGWKSWRAFSRKLRATLEVRGPPGPSPAASPPNGRPPRGRPRSRS